MENSHIVEDPSKLSVSQKVLSAVKPKYFCEKKSDELHSKWASTVHQLASKRTVNHVHTTLEKNFIALFVQGVPLIFPHHDKKAKNMNSIFWKLGKAQKMKWRWLFHQRVVGKKIWFFRPPMMSFAFLDMIFGGKGLQIDTYKPPKCIWSYHTHVVNTRWPYVYDMTK